MGLRYGGLWQYGTIGLLEYGGLWQYGTIGLLGLSRYGGTIHAKMEVNFFVMQITHVFEPNGAQSKKQKKKFRKNGFASMVSDIKKITLLAVNEGSFN